MVRAMLSKSSRKSGCILAMVLGGIFERLQGGSGSDAVSLHDGLRVDPHLDQLFGFAQQFSSENTNTGCAITDFVILHFGNVDKDLGSGVVEDGSI